MIHTRIPNMQRMLLLMLLTMMFSTAYSTGNDRECQGGHNCNGGDIDIDVTGGSSGADASSDSASSADAESASSSGASSDNNVTITNTRPKSTTVRNVPSPDTPNVYPSAPCRIARSAGLSFAGGALSGGASIEDVECTLRETARVFQYLGVPEVGLHLMCTNSHIINGRYDKKGNLEKGAPTPIGTAECLRLIRMFQGSDDESDSSTALQTEVEILREQQDRIESGLVGRVNELEDLMEQQTQAPAPRPIVTEQTVHQPRMSLSQKADMAALFEEKAE
jgi:hypothetical protein